MFGLHHRYRSLPPSPDNLPLLPCSPLWKSQDTKIYYYYFTLTKELWRAHKVHMDLQHDRVLAAHHAHHDTSLLPDLER